MAFTVSDILRDADLFRRAYPSWPHAEPEEAPVTPVIPAPACWADPLSRRERIIVAGLLARACHRFWTAAEPRLPDARCSNALAYALAASSGEMSDLHLDVTERAEAATS